MTEPGYHGTTTVWKPCDENKCKKPATHGNFCNEHAPPHAVYTGSKRMVTPRTASATLRGEDGDEDDDEDKGKKKSLCDRIFCRGKFKSKKTSKKSVKKTSKKSVKKAPKKSVKKAPKKSVKKTPKKSVKKAPKKSVKKTPKKSHARRV